MRYLVVGSGIRGICDCLAILREYPASDICLIDASKSFGGGVSGLAVEDFAVDPGVHLFDSISRDFASFLENIAAGGLQEITVKSASTFNGEKTDGFSLPDLSSLDTDVTTKIRKEILAENSNPGESDDSLEGLFRERFGPTASGIYSDIYRHIYSVTSSEVSKDAVHSTSLHRIKFDSDETMLELKNQSSRLDDALAARRAQRDTSSDTSVTVYPADGRGMTGLNHDIYRWLLAAGTDIRLSTTVQSVQRQTVGGSKVVLSDGHTVTVDRIVWSANNFDTLLKFCRLDGGSLSEHMHHAPMVLAVLVGEEQCFSDYTYMQNFDIDRVTYRSASAGMYSKQNNAGRTFVTCECPADIGSDHWIDHTLLKDRLYADLLATGFMQSTKDVTPYFFNAPKTFFAPKIQFGSCFEQLAQRAWEEFGIFVKDPRVFFRREMIADSHRLAETGFERCS